MEQTLYSVAEAAALTGEKSSALRYWEEQFALDIRRNARGSRCYSGEDIRIFLCIQELKKKGYSLKEIGEVLPLLQNPADVREEEERRKRFYEILEHLFRELKLRKRQEDRYRRVDEAIRRHQIARKQVAVTEEQSRKKRK
ncbi:MAG TPA: MerR family transcriptional regulator [Candidatus Scatomonas merdavium]|nr:MerR family transcriptional regulator [Candidatus Scatomonas merdavium]